MHRRGSRTEVALQQDAYFLGDTTPSPVGERALVPAIFAQELPSKVRIRASRAEIFYPTPLESLPASPKATTRGGCPITSPVIALAAPSLEPRRRRA